MARGILLLLVLVRVFAAPLAEASPPDPIWIGGLYDEGDADDLVTLLVSLTSVTDQAGTPSAGRTVCGQVAALAVARVAAPIRIDPHDRAPPRS